MTIPQAVWRYLLFFALGIVLPIASSWLEFKFNHGQNSSTVWWASLLVAAGTIALLPLSKALRFCVFLLWVPLFFCVTFVFGMHFLHGTSFSAK
jgi:hypothetical protein